MENQTTFIPTQHTLKVNTDGEKCLKKDTHRSPEREKETDREKEAERDRERQRDRDRNRQEE